MTALKFPISITETDYLAGEQHSDIRHEYINGYVYAMSGGSAAHSLIIGNLHAHLHQHLRQTRCCVFMSDMKLKVQLAEETRYYYPDVQVSCESTDTASTDYFKTRPILIVEVLSKTTERVDRFEKFEAYRQIETVQEYVLIAQDMQKVEIYRRIEDWDGEKYLHDMQILFKSVDLLIPIADIYEKVIA